MRDLRNHTSQVIDAVKAGERVTLTVNGNPVADIVPHGRRERWLSGPWLHEQLRERAADPALTHELAELAGSNARGSVSATGVGLLDTSVFIARETGRALGALPQRSAISVVTVGELHLGVLAAADDEVRARRADTLSLARSADPIPISEAVMSAWARIVIDCRGAGIQRTVKLTDALIAATAVEHGLPIVTQDGDFDQIAAVHPALSVIRV